jgi:hypothetical protein
MAGYRGPSIDHGLLSPDGHMSKRARDAANKREKDRLFPPGFWDRPEPTADEKRAAEVIRLRRAAAQCRDLATRGMRTRYYNKQAAMMEARAAELENEG